MEKAKTAMLIASVVGSLAGIYYTLTLNPLNNYFIFAVLFALIGIGVANVVMLVLYKVYEWLKQYYSDVERTQNTPNG